MKDEHVSAFIIALIAGFIIGVVVLSFMGAR